MIYLGYHYDWTHASVDCVCDRSPMLHSLHPGLVATRHREQMRKDCPTLEDPSAAATAYEIGWQVGYGALLNCNVSITRYGLWFTYLLSVDCPRTR